MIGNSRGWFKWNITTLSACETENLIAVPESYRVDTVTIEKQCPETRHRMRHYYRACMVNGCRCGQHTLRFQGSQDTLCAHTLVKGLG